MEEFLTRKGCASSSKCSFNSSAVFGTLSSVCRVSEETSSLLSGPAVVSGPSSEDSAFWSGGAGRRPGRNALGDHSCSGRQALVALRYCILRGLFCRRCYTQVRAAIRNHRLHGLDLIVNACLTRRLTNSRSRTRFMDLRWNSNLQDPTLCKATWPPKLWSE